MRPRTLLAQALGSIDPKTRAIIRPINVSTTYERDPDNGYSSGNSYGRPHNDTVREAEAIVAALEGAAGALAFGSGMAAATAVFLTLPPGAHVLVPKVFYWALRRWLNEGGGERGLMIESVDMADLDAVRGALRPGETRLLWLETPANPLWSLCDIAGLCDIAHQAGARVAVDSTCASPILTRPLELGADIVMHSATKYLNGHSDVIAGVLATRVADEPWARLERLRYTFGALLGPFEAYLLIRGLRTMDLRVRAANASALALALRFHGHPRVAEVLYPGLPSHPQHDLARRQMGGLFGAMLSIRVRGGEQAAIATAARVSIWKRATSLGGVESLIEHRASIEGEGSPCPRDLLRLSTGIEDVDDLAEDLESALA